MSTPAHNPPRPATTVSYQLVEDALEHLWDYAYLETHPLSALHRIPDSLEGTHAMHVGPGKALNLCLQGIIKRLSPPHAVCRSVRERRYFDILHGCYVGRETNKTVAWKLGMADRTFYRRRRQAIEMITQMLADLHG
ncbi:MAG: hypothetical protein HZB53_06475 [Chloroflexi bacterium]|nr:hypothetical protein [Chloroflexota bacterium]